MNFLTPLYALAALAIAAPILFHLVRKRPKDRQIFSSLMFLEPAAPRLTQQSRVDHWLLLALRVAAIAMLAVAFSRPYWNTASLGEAPALGLQRVFLLDCSASMQRDGMMEQAKAKIKDLIEQSKITDTIAVYAFDQSLRPLLSIEEAIQVLPSQRQSIAADSLKKASPTWNRTDLGLALVQATDALQAQISSIDEGVAGVGEIVVVTDLQSGMKLDALVNYTWPANTRVRVERIESGTPGNANATLLNAASAEQLESTSVDANQVRVRVTNSPKSNVNEFRLSWRNTRDEIVGTESRTSVPSGGSAVTAMPAPSAEVQYLKLVGDLTDFDNKYYVATQQSSSCSVLVMEPKSRDREDSLGYFIAQIPLSTPTRIVNVETREPDDATEWPSPSTTPWIIVASELKDRDLNGLSAYLEQGGNVLWVLDQSISKDTGFTSEDYQKAFVRIADTAVEVTEAKSRDYSMLERIDFRHPVFADLADAKFNDFTKIRFWNHRALLPSEPNRWKILASFDDGSPALVSKEKGKGLLWVLAAGWQPSQSQLALSSKFVPIISNLFRIAAHDVQDANTYYVGDEVIWNDQERIVDPTGKALEGAAYGDTTSDEATSSDASRKMYRCSLWEPGIYQRWREDKMVQTFAVNLNESESLVLPADSECLERLGVNMADYNSPERAMQKQLQLQAIELEAQQGWWRWLVIGVLGLAGTESAVCIIRSRSR
jgi:hypothetical protein